MDLVPDFLFVIFCCGDEDEKEVPRKPAKYKKKGEQVHLDVSFEPLKPRQAGQPGKTTWSPVTQAARLGLRRRLSLA